MMAARPNIVKLKAGPNYKNCKRGCCYCRSCRGALVGTVLLCSALQPPSPFPDIRSSFSVHIHPFSWDKMSVPSERAYRWTVQEGQGPFCRGDQRDWIREFAPGRFAALPRISLSLSRRRNSPKSFGLISILTKIVIVIAGRDRARAIRDLCGQDRGAARPFEGCCCRRVRERRVMFAIFNSCTNTAVHCCMGRPTRSFCQAVFVKPISVFTQSITCSPNVAQLKSVWRQLPPPRRS